MLYHLVQTKLSFHLEKSVKLFRIESTLFTIIYKPYLFIKSFASGTCNDFRVLVRSFSSSSMLVRKSNGDPVLGSSCSNGGSFDICGFSAFDSIDDGWLSAMNKRSIQIMLIRY